MADEVSWVSCHAMALLHLRLNLIALQRATPEVLFRSVSLVIADNARSEYMFLATFFGQPEDDVRHSSLERTNIPWTRKLRYDNLTSETTSSQLSSLQDDDSASFISDGNSFSTTTGAGGVGGKSEKLKRHVADGIWKQVFEPTLEYAKVSVLSFQYQCVKNIESSFQDLQNFTATLLTQSYPNALSILSMTRLNDSLVQQLIGEDKSGACPTVGMEAHLIGIRLQLWPLFQKEMGTNIDSVKRLSEGTNSGMAGILGVRNTTVKDSVVTAVKMISKRGFLADLMPYLQVVKRYAAFFISIVGLSADQEDDMVFNS